MKEYNTQNYEDLIGKHQKFKEIKELSTAVDFDFASTNGDMLKEKRKKHNACQYIKSISI